MFRKIYNMLLESYGPRGWWPILSRAGKKGFDSRGYHKEIYDYPRTFNDRFEIIIGAILTQNTNWKNVEKAMKKLEEAGLLTPEKILQCSLEKLAEFIRSSGYFNQKAKKLKGMAEFLISTGYMKHGKMPEREALLEIRGVGPETADSVLLYACHIPVFVIDAYTKRIFSRLGLVDKNIKYEDLRKIFHKKLKSDSTLYNEYHALLVEHGKQHCRTKPVCKGCPLKKQCRYS